MKRGGERKFNLVGRKVGIDIGEPNYVATFFSPDDKLAENFSFNMRDNGYSEFRKRIPTDVKTAFAATDLAYSVDSRLLSLGSCDIKVFHLNELS